ncbi:hypothetical protein EYC84_004632 [Monilinia fructicola]|uniref:Uncharacterized protein n=1 Tax=Monilinia fructicola TaxID=38448 RepID=A0A5M9K4W3_MONFR|nr:hypothetical protein EYC84_004632 [Monilinia fructicola]
MVEEGREDVDVLCTCTYQALQWVDAYRGRNHGVTEGKYQLQCQNVSSETLEEQNCKMVSKLWYFYVIPPIHSHATNGISPP